VERIEKIKLIKESTERQILNEFGPALRILGPLLKVFGRGGVPKPSPIARPFPPTVPPRVPSPPPRVPSPPPSGAGKWLGRAGNIGKDVLLWNLMSGGSQPPQSPTDSSQTIGSPVSSVDGGGFETSTKGPDYRAKLSRHAHHQRGPFSPSVIDSE